LEVEMLPYKIKMLRNWELTAECSRFLTFNNRVEEAVIADMTTPQMCMVVYSPNVYQKVID